MSHIQPFDRAQFVDKSVKGVRYSNPSFCLCSDGFFYINFTNPEEEPCECCPYCYVKSGALKKNHTEVFGYPDPELVRPIDDRSSIRDIVLFPMGDNGPHMGRDYYGMPYLEYLQTIATRWDARLHIATQHPIIDKVKYPDDLSRVTLWTTLTSAHTREQQHGVATVEAKLRGLRNWPGKKGVFLLLHDTDLGWRWVANELIGQVGLIGKHNLRVALKVLRLNVGMGGKYVNGYNFKTSNTSTWNYSDQVAGEMLLYTYRHLANSGYNVGLCSVRGSIIRWLGKNGITSEDIADMRQQYNS
jgi:hypothetical protein